MGTHDMGTQMGTGWKNDNCIGLKVAKTLVSHFAMSICQIGEPLMLQLKMWLYSFEENDAFLSFVRSFFKRKTFLLALRLVKMLTQ